MHILDFIFQERSAHLQRKVLGPESPSEGTTDSSPRSVPSPKLQQSTNVPPYVQLFQPRASAFAKGHQTGTSQRSNTLVGVTASGVATQQQPALETTTAWNPEAPTVLQEYAPTLVQVSGLALTQSPDEGSHISSTSADTSAYTSVRQASIRVPNAECSTLQTVSSSAMASSSGSTEAVAEAVVVPAAATVPTQEAPSETPSSLGFQGCRSRACAGVMDTFKRALRPRETSQLASPPGPALSILAAHQLDAAVAATNAPAAAAVASTGATDAGSEDRGSEADSGSACPPDTWQLGRATWTFLHSVAAHYPDQPSQQQQKLMRDMMEGVAEFYPCEVCREHLREQVCRNPPQVTSAKDLNLWLCSIHNEVNELLGKPLFDCSRLMDRWRDGPPDGSCD